MNSLEKQTAFAVALMISLRMYGLFLILPVFSVAASNYENTSPFLMGLAIGAYGLTQALLQIPLGLASDLWGRKKILFFGLLLFIAGSVIAAMADNIYWVIIGRFVQGTGAIASTGMALIADVSRPEQRTKMMALVGSSIGLAFMLAFVTAPLLFVWKGLSGLFWITAILATVALIVLVVFIKEAPKKTKQTVVFKDVLKTLKMSALLSLNVSVFVIHAAMTSVFVIIPLLLVQQFEMEVASHWKIYLPVLIASVLIFVPLIIVYEKMKKYFAFIGCAILALAATIGFLSATSSYFAALVFGLVLYFAFFNFLEASMPSLLSRICGETYRGSAMGAYSASQFLGAFSGSFIAGILLPFGSQVVFSALILTLILSAIFVLINRKKSLDSLRKEL